MRFALPLLLLFATAPSFAAESPPVRSSRVTATLVSDTDQVAAGVPIHLGLRLQMAPGWHTYARNPGDAGLPTDLTLDVPAGPIAWPVPQRLQEGPLLSYGYTGSVLLPVSVTPGDGLHVTANATWLVCQKICVPEEGHFSLDLPAGTPSPSAEAPLFAAAATQTPRPSPFAAHIAADGTLSLSGAELSPDTVKEAWFIPDEGVNASRGFEVEDGAVLIRLATPKTAPTSLTGTVVLRDARGEESILAVQATPGSAPTFNTGVLPLAEALLFAVLGGFILNLMPCVFPILAMKAMGLARLSGSERRVVRWHAASYTAGVVSAFAALGGILLALRGAGAAVGWGFQFQSPLGVTLLAWLLFLVGLNLSGVFAVGGRLAGVGAGLTRGGGHLGSFGTGVLAVLVATPCTAPFMGAAIAAALAAPGPLPILVFVAMGLGLASPYALLGIAPGLARLLPRPGAWMDLLRGALAFPMYGAFVWLLWVASLEAGEAGVLTVAGGALLLALGAWALGLAQRSNGRLRSLGRSVAVLACVGAGATLLRLDVAPRSEASARAESVEHYTPARLAELRAEGRPVFVNMTAAWCVTCLVNERIALTPERVRAAFTKYGVAYLKGDWTGGDPAITSFLREHARDGVPLYVLFPAGNAKPTVLPQILTEATMLSELGKLGS
ncbi:MAG: protein-disulfide reductase DsbD family protein [Janthinobacterium lividum]